MLRIKHEAKYEHKKEGDLRDKIEVAVKKSKERIHEAKTENQGACVSEEANS